MALMITLFLGALLVVGGIQWLGDRRDRSLPGPERERLDRLESALSSLESRLDDLQDQQRFLERLLAERPDQQALEPGDEGPGSSPGGSDSILFDNDAGE